MITPERLKEVLRYDPRTGFFRWVAHRYSWRVSAIAGCLDDYGYVIINIDNKNYKAHRLAWMYTYGFFPEKQIDHINGDKNDNRFDNIRLATRLENSHNQHDAHCDSNSGIRGVGMKKGRTKYRVQISIDGKPREFSANTLSEAKTKYIELKKQHQPFAYA